MPLMGSLYIGASGLQTSQNALNTTAHNLSNIDTKGYTRQQVMQATREYNTISLSFRGVSNQQVGLGTYYSKVKQARDYFLDQTYRKESGRSAYFDTSATAMEEVETLLGEMQGASFSTALDDLWTSIQELSKDPSASVGKGLLVNKATVFLERAQSVYKGLTDYQDNLNLQVKNAVDRINYYGKELKSLNDQIRKVEAAGIESPNDLRDARNQILDELSKLAKTTYSEGIDGTVSVQIEGVDFVKKDMVYEIGMQQDVATGFYTPYWTQNAKYTTNADGTKTLNIDGAEVFNLTREISAAKDTDRGGLKALLLARGDRRTNYTDLDESVYNSGVSSSIMMNVEAEFDALIHNITTKMNEVIANAANPATGYLCEENENGDMIPLQLFQKLGSVGYDPDKIGTAEAGDPPLPYDENGYLREDPTKTETLYTVNNLKINQTLLSEPTRLDLVKPDGELDYALGAALKEAFSSDEYTLNPNVNSPCTLAGFYRDLVIQVGNTGMIFRSMQETQEAELESIEFAREEVLGVSSEEELSNMVKFQNAYNAASRYINVVDEMLEHILTTLGS